MRAFHDLLTTSLPASNGAARRLTTKENVKTALNITVSTEDTLLDQQIDRATAMIVDWCGLARDAAGSLPTFASETLIATWYRDLCIYDRGLYIYLPHRVPVTSITSITVDGVALSGSDYKITAANPGKLLRLDSAGNPTCWSAMQIAVTFLAGWTLPTGVPADVEQAAIAQCSHFYLSRDRDPTLRSEAVPDVYSSSWSVPGGDSMSGALLPQVEAALAPYRNVSV